MLDAALRDGTAERQCTFEVFARRLPDGRRYGVVAGTGRLIDAIADFRFGADDRRLAAPSRASSTTAGAHFLADYRFRGDVDGYPEGELYFPHSPLLTVTGTFADAVVLETLVLSILNHDAAVAVGRRPDGDRRPGPADHRDGLAAHARAGRGRRRPRRLPGRLRLDVEPGRAARVRHPDRRHRRARVHPAARRRGGGVPGPDRQPRRRHDAAGRHLRHHRRHRDRGRGRRARPRRDPHRLRRPRRAGPPRPRAARRARRDRHPHRASAATSTSSRSPRWPPTRSTPTAPARRSSPARARRPPGWSTSWSRWTDARWPSGRSTRRPRAAASGPFAPTSRAAPRSRRSSSPTGPSWDAPDGRPRRCSAR